VLEGNLSQCWKETYPSTGRKPIPVLEGNLSQYWKETYPSATFFTTNPKWNALGCNPALRVE